ncbi:MAG: hypothetical protein CMJ84_09670 [Planctomycetes bacterium]|jgi:hypothetical protein|nr:hypothetical protein [Planctomycetota bacterium]MDP6410058.1 putative ABC exporter domain-containing protein [Planctomycetota bacterium]
MILGHRGLSTLARLKLRGTLRRQARRLRTPSGILFALLGLALMTLWLGAILFNRELGDDFGPARQPASLVMVEACLAAFTVMSLSGALNHRGIFFPPHELETLFSAPVTRGDLVRHRMQVDLARSLFGGVIFSLLIVSRLAHPLLGFAGTFLSLITLSALRQLVSLVLCAAGGRLSGFLGGRLTVLLQIGLGITLWLGLMMALFGDTFFLPEQSSRLHAGFERALEGPFLAALVSPWRPWAEMMVAATFAGFLSWALPCALVLPLLFEVTARLGVDYREASIQTAGVIERRIKRLGTSGPLGSGEVTGAVAARRNPWPFGRGPARAVAWIRTAEILRRARGTLLRSALVLGLVTLGAGFVVPVGEAGALGGHIVVAWVGLVYLGAGMRFDFRADFDRLEQIKTWPIGPGRLFLATLLPGALLISLLVATAIGIRALVLGTGHSALALALILGTLPICALAWIAVDNIVFLCAPVRFAPGQVGALHHAGRGMALMFLRLVVMLVALSLVALAAAAAFFAADTGLELGGDIARAWAIAAGLGALLAVATALVWIGGRLLHRFDVARDRP